MRARNLFALIVCALLAASGAGAADPPSPLPDLSYYATETSDTPGTLGVWERALKQSLRSQSLERAADGLAARYGLSAANMRELATLWVTGQAAYSGLSDAETDALRRRYLALIGATARNPLVLQAAASTLSGQRECNPDDFEALLAGSPDPAGEAWLVVGVSDCPAWYQKYLAFAPGRPTAALIRILQDGHLRPADALPLYAWLTSEQGLARIRESDRPAVAARLNSRFIRLLLETGLLDEAIAVWDRLPPGQRGPILAGGLSRIEAEADGLGFAMMEIDKYRGVTTDLAAAMALNGRKSDAEALLAPLGGAEATRRAFDCIIAAGSDQRRAKACGEFEERDSGPILLIDHLLHRDGEDPYLLAETFFGSGRLSDWSAASVDLRCRIFSEPLYSDICEDGRNYVVRRNRGETYPAEAKAADEAAKAVESAAIPGFAALKARYAAALAAIDERYGGASVPPSSYLARPSVEPEPPPFERRPLPADLPAAPAASAASYSRALPQGFEPIRAERDGDRVVVISVSQNYDPVGEVSRGGYWVHLSDDGGKTWRRPLYTGLAEFFPYVVQPTSRLPLLSGDALDIEVQLLELDTASISYPPVGLRTRRRESGLYLHVPLADLQRDSDGDGLTDVAERHLLLDSPPSAGGTPMIVGASRAGQCSPSPERQAIAALLAEIFSLPTGGIIEPTDRPGAFAGINGGWRAPSNSADRPIFILGDPADYACLRSDRLMIVYGQADIDRLRRFTPDFHAVSVGKIVYNRARDRGYVVWSSGWTGGTIRLSRKADGSWQRETISSWIS